MDKYEETQQRLVAMGLGRTGRTNLVILHEALKRGVSITRKPGRRRFDLEHEGRRHTWLNGSTSLNSPLAKRVARNKEVSNRYLRAHGIHCPENAVFSSTEADRAWAWAASLGPLVVKPRDGRQGQGVHVNIQTRDQLRQVFSQLAPSYDHLLVEEFVTGHERRCLVVDNELVATIDRRPPNVLGDGSSTIRELVALKNANRGPIHKALKLDDHELSFIRAKGYEADDVLESGAQLSLRQNINLHSGGDAVDASAEITELEREAVEEVSRSMPGLRLAGLDVIFSRNNAGDPVSVIEINDQPMISMHHFPWEGEIRDVAADILNAMFPKTIR